MASQNIFNVGNSWDWMKTRISTLPSCSAARLILLPLFRPLDSKYILEFSLVSTVDLCVEVNNLPKFFFKMTNLRHYQGLRKRLQNKWKEILIPVQYEFYDPYAADTEYQEFECLGTETFLEQGDPLPPLIPGYSFYNDRGDESVNSKEKTVSSIGCQTAMDDTVNEIKLLQEQIQFKTQQNEYIDRIVNGQYNLMEYLEKEINRLNQYIEDHALKDFSLEEKVFLNHYVI